MTNGVVRLRVFGKGGKRIRRIIGDKPLARALGMPKAAPGEMLFRWKDKDGEDRCLNAETVHGWLRDRFSDTTSAKDFGASRASSIVAAALQDAGQVDKHPKLAMLRQAIKEASEFLASTPTVCKAAMSILMCRQHSRMRLSMQLRCFPVRCALG